VRPKSGRICPQTSNQGVEHLTFWGCLGRYDAWNRLAGLYEDNGTPQGQWDWSDTLVTAYQDDAMGR